MPNENSLLFVNGRVTTDHLNTDVKQFATQPSRSRKGLLDVTNTRGGTIASTTTAVKTKGKQRARRIPLDPEFAVLSIPEPAFSDEETGARLDNFFQALSTSTSHKMAPIKQQLPQQASPFVVEQIPIECMNHILASFL